MGYSQKSLIVNSISVEGNSKTKTEIILRELGFKVSDSLEVSAYKKILEQGRLNIFNTNLFLKALINSEISENGDSLEVVILVTERWYFIALPVLMLADRNFNEWWYERDKDLTRITYGVNAKHFNLSGNNDKLTLIALGGFVPYFEVTYVRPYIDKRKRIGVKGGVFYSTQRNVAVRTYKDKLSYFASESKLKDRRGAFFEINLRNTLYHFHSLSLAYTNSNIADTVAKINPNYFGTNILNQKLFSISYDYVYDKRDNRQYATKGDYFYGQLGSNFILGKEFYSQTSLFFLYAKFFKLNNKIFLEETIRTKVSSPQNQPYTLTRGLGYRNNQIRGYDLYVIDGQNTLLLKSTLNYRLIKRALDLSRFIKWSQLNSLPVAVYPNLFVDFGYVKNYFPELSNSKLSNKNLIGSGVGLDIVTWYDTTVKMYYSINNLYEKRLFVGFVKDF